MKWREVKSSNVSSVAYNEDTRILSVRYSTGDVYRYYDVPITVYNALLEARSVGSFIHKQIRSFYSARKDESVEVRP